MRRIFGAKSFLIAVLASLAATTGVAKESDWTGFACNAADGSTARFNINLRESKYDDGEGEKKLSRVTETKITLRGPNPFAMSTPIGPIITSLELDRVSQVLTDQTFIPDRGINRIVQYQCQIVSPIDFKNGRAF